MIIQGKWLLSEEEHPQLETYPKKKRKTETKQMHLINLHLPSPLAGSAYKVPLQYLTLRTSFICHSQMQHMYVYTCL